MTSREPLPTMKSREADTAGGKGARSHAHHSRSGVAPAAAGLARLVERARLPRLAIIGLVKNAGKTTVLNSLMDRSTQRFGLTSLGLDGERSDHLTGLAKPRIAPPAGALVATTTGSLDRSQYTMRVLDEMPFRTALGRVVIGVASGGDRPVEISGPTTLAQVRATADRLIELGAEQVVVDGAINRLGSASPRVTDGLIMATGAMVGDSLEETIAITRDTFSMLNLPVVSADTRALLDGSTVGARLLSIDGRGRRRQLEAATAVGEGIVVARDIQRLGTRVLYCAGAVTQEFVDDLARVLPPKQQLTLVVRDATVLVLPSVWVARLQRRGIDVQVLHGLRVVAVTTNPFRLPQPLNPRLFFNAVVDVVGDRAPVFDVVNGLAHMPASAHDVAP